MPAGCDVSGLCLPGELSVRSVLPVAPPGKYFENLLSQAMWPSTSAPTDASSPTGGGLIRSTATRGACQGPRPQFLLNFSKTVALVCSKSHCCVREEGLQAFMKILWSLSLQSMQLPLTGWYSVLSYRTGSAVSSGNRAAMRATRKQGPASVRPSPAASVVNAASEPDLQPRLRPPRVPLCPCSLQRLSPFFLLPPSFSLSLFFFSLLLFQGLAM